MFGNECKVIVKCTNFGTLKIVLRFFSAQKHSVFDTL